MEIRYEELPHSSYLDFAGYRSGLTALEVQGDAAPFGLNVALVLDRAADPKPLLDLDWASRQRELARLEAEGTLWDLFGADRANYRDLLAALDALGIQTADSVAPTNGYTSSAESRTVWLQLDNAGFAKLFGPNAAMRTLVLPQGAGTRTTPGWEGNLSLPEGWASGFGITGLWFDDNRNFVSPMPPSGTYPEAVLPPGPLSPGNHSREETQLSPQEIAQRHYNFPFQGSLWDPTSQAAVPTAAIGLIEPGIGAAMLQEGTSFQSGLTAYRHSVGIGTAGAYVEIAPGGADASLNYDPGRPYASWAAERSLDVGVATAINPQSTLLLYAGSGFSGGAQSNPYTAFQQAFWDDVNAPQVVSSSFGFEGLNTPDSPFYRAADELFTDAALRNIAAFYFAGDGGSGNQWANGLTNVRGNQTGPYVTVVGGTAISTLHAARHDDTLAMVVSEALAGDRETLWTLMAGGLGFDPVGAMEAGDADGGATFVEAIWNRYRLEEADGTSYITNVEKDPATGTGYLSNNTGSGSADPSRPVPAYQTAYGLTPTTADPLREVGRGVPDVSALAGGNMDYTIPDWTMLALTSAGGTSASTPLMAALATQIDAVFADQGLPNLGYHNDLYYIAAAILPGAFNDVRIGNNTSSVTFEGPLVSDHVAVTATGFGYEAALGYDLASGLGSPNGLLLARTVAQIAHHQWSHAANPPVLSEDTGGRWVSPVAQSLLVQAMLPAPGTVTLEVGSRTETFDSTEASRFAWNGRLATQALQPDFASGLVHRFDRDTQGTMLQIDAKAGEALSLEIDGLAVAAFRARLTAPYGFADFRAGIGDEEATIRVARPVAVAETVGAAQDQVAVVRLRQNGALPNEVLLYRVDDLLGRIDGLLPDAPGYAEASLARAYATTGGEAWIPGPGAGQQSEAMLRGVDSGDLVAMRLHNGARDFWAFAEANERDASGRPVPHLWHYALNTWGWEDLAGGGDRDFNDLVVQIDFTSAAGSGWLV